MIYDVNITIRWMHPLIPKRNYAPRKAKEIIDKHLEKKISPN
jgi:hypothetical protein